jgi:UrcA family protein
MLRNIFPAAFLVLSVTAAAAVETPRQMQVSLRDLNLSRPEGQAVAQARIHAAAVRLCGSARSTADQGWANSPQAVSDRACVARAIERANAQIASSVGN